MLGIHIAVGFGLISLNLAAGLLGGIAWFRKQPSIPFWYLLRAAQASVFLQALLGGLVNDRCGLGCLVRPCRRIGHRGMLRYAATSQIG